MGSATRRTSPLSLHDALPIFRDACGRASTAAITLAMDSMPDIPGMPPAPAGIGRITPRSPNGRGGRSTGKRCPWQARSEEHTSELQSHSDLVCRLLLEKKNQE